MWKKYQTLKQFYSVARMIQIWLVIIIKSWAYGTKN